MTPLIEARAKWTKHHAPIEKAYNKASKAFKRSCNATTFTTLIEAQDVYYISLAAKPMFIGPLAEIGIMEILITKKGL